MIVPPFLAIIDDCMGAAFAECWDRRKFLPCRDVGIEPAGQFARAGTGIRLWIIQVRSIACKTAAEVNPEDHEKPQNRMPLRRGPEPGFGGIRIGLGHGCPASLSETRSSLLLKLLVLLAHELKSLK